MKKTVFKYPLTLSSPNQIDTPGELSRPIHVGCSNGELCIWFEVYPGEEERSGIYIVTGTGHEVSTHWGYIGSVIMPNGLVWHVWRVY